MAANVEHTKKLFSYRLMREELYGFRLRSASASTSLALRKRS